MRETLVGTTPDGQPVHCLTIGGPPGPLLEVLTLGATVHRLEVACGDGVRRNVVLGHADIADRLASTDYIGGTIGRYANRIAGGRVPIDGREFQVGVNDRGHSLHGGPEGFDRRVWAVVSHEPDRVELALTSPDGDQGFPGELAVRAAYQVVDAAVRMEMTARTDAPTVVNLTNHAYFNLDGAGTGTIDDHLLTVHADEYTPVDATGIPRGGHATVAGTPFDLREPARVGERVRTRHEQVVDARGVDHNLVVRGDGLRAHAVLESPRTGTRLELRSDQPGLQVYTGNFLDGARSGEVGRLYRQGDGIALEPQLFPDSPHHPEWPSAVLRPGEEYRASLEWRFSGTPARR